MALLQSPSQVSENPIVKGLIYGQPGVGKSTLALSAPNPVMIDADKGMYRVEKRLQVPSLPLTSYKALLELFDSGELAPFETVIFDTLGKLVDRIGEYVIEVNPKNKQGDGSLSMKGWGAVKLEFQKLLKKAESQNKHLIFVAHEKEEKDGDVRIVRPDVSGSSGKDIVKEMDFMGYIEMRGDRHMISFTPCEKFYAKNSLHLPAFIQIPNIADHPNDFIQRNILDRTKARLQEEQVISEQYNLLLKNTGEQIAAVNTAEDANTVLELLEKTQVIWDSERRLKRSLFERTKAIDLVYNKETKKFEVAAATPVSTPAAQTAAPAQTAQQPVQQAAPQQTTAAPPAQAASAPPVQAPQQEAPQQHQAPQDNAA